MPDRLFFTDSDEANALIASDPMALLVGFALDQQITVQKAFSGPLALRERLGSLDAGTLASADLEPVFRTRPVIHRYPRSMARRLHELAVHVRDRYDGDAARIWNEAGDSDALRARLAALPGFGEMKIKALGSVLAKHFGVEAARELVPWHPTLGDVDSPQALADYQAAKRVHKAEWSKALPIALAVLAVLGLAGTATSAAARDRAAPPQLQMNQIQVIGTHNSYHRELSKPERGAHDAVFGGQSIYDAFLAYSHASLPNQLSRQGVRGLELDLYPDPQGGLYANPLLRQRLAAGPLTDPEWYRPGIKVLHTEDLDYNSTCVRLTTCLRLVRQWSRANRRHVPLLVMLELKGTDPVAGPLGGVAVPPWDGPALDSLDQEIRGIFRRGELITPDDVRRRALSLEQSVLRSGWPRLSRARGRVAFLMDNDPGPISAAYTAGRPSLQGRVLFTNARPGSPDAAFVKRNEPTDANLAQIQRLVRRGYLVRTRSDVPLGTVVSGDETQLRAALASGAQLVSTDFPEVGMSARYDSDFVVALPEGGPARCNPVIRPRGCRSRRLERSRAARSFARRVATARAR